MGNLNAVNLQKIVVVVPQHILLQRLEKASDSCDEIDRYNILWRSEWRVYL